MYRFCVFVVLCASVVGVAQAQYTGTRGIALTPLMIRESIRPGTTGSVSLSVSNLEPTVIGVGLELQSATFPSPNYVPKLGSTHEMDATGWFETSSLQRRIDPARDEEFRIKYTVPRSARGVYWTMITVSPSLSGPNPFLASFQVPVIFFVGTQVRPELQVLSPELATAGNRLQVVLPFRNVSNGFATIRAVGDVRQVSTGRVVARFDDRDRNLYPNTSRFLRADVPKLPDGTYQVSVRAEAGRRSFPSITRFFTVTKGKAVPSDPGKALTVAPILVDPGSFAAALPPAARRTFSVKLTNTSDRPVKAAIGVGRLVQTSTGALSVSEQRPESVVVQTPSSVVDLGPKGTTYVMFEVETTPSFARDEWFAVTFRDADDGNSVGEMIQGVVSIQGAHKPKLELEAGLLEAVDGYPVRVPFKVKNTGDEALQPLPTAVILEQGVRVVGRLDVPVLGDGGVLPGSVLQNSVALPPGLKPGGYQLLVRYQYGTTLFAELRVPFGVNPPAKRKPAGKVGKRR